MFIWRLKAGKSYLSLESNWLGDCSIGVQCEHRILMTRKQSSLEIGLQQSRELTQRVKREAMYTYSKHRLVEVIGTPAKLKEATSSRRWDRGWRVLLKAYPSFFIRYWTPSKKEMWDFGAHENKWRQYSMIDMQYDHWLIEIKTPFWS